MFTVALFIIANTWKQPKCPLTNKWIKIHTHTNGILISHIKNEILINIFSLDCSALP